MVHVIQAAAKNHLNKPIHWNHSQIYWFIWGPVGPTEAFFIWGGGVGVEN